MSTTSTLHRRTLLAAPLALGAMAARAQGTGSAPQSALVPLAVVASFSILAEMARQVGGDRVAVRAIVGPDIDAHLFEPRPSDVSGIAGARLLIRNGLGFEPWLDRLTRAAGYAGPIVTTTDGIAPRSMTGHAHDHGATARRANHYLPPSRTADPHCWQDLALGQRYVAAILAGLIAADPAGEAHYRRNAAAYSARLAALDTWVRGQIATVPAARRVVVTSHDAFGYFGAAYGVRFLAPQGVSTTAEPSAAEVALLIRQIRADAITAVFVENMSNPATLQRLATEAGVRIRGRLYADALSAPDGPAASYEAMFRHNIGLLVPAMRGEG